MDAWKYCGQNATSFTDLPWSKITAGTSVKSEHPLSLENIAVDSPHATAR